MSFVAFMDPTLLIQQVGRELSRVQGKRDKRFFSLQILGCLNDCAKRHHPLLGRCLNNKSHDKDCNRDSATEVGNVRVESFHSAIADSVSLLFFLWAMAKA